MKRFFPLLACLSLISASLVATANEGVIVHRQGIFKITHGHLLSLKSILLLKHGNPTDILYHAEGIRAAYDHLGEAFPSGSEDGETRTKQNIWSERAKFDKLMNESDEAVNAMLVSAKEENQKQQVKAFKELAGSCKTCHDDFRKK
jgi:cytochrome c556